MSIRHQADNHSYYRPMLASIQRINVNYYQ